MATNDNTSKDQYTTPPPSDQEPENLIAALTRAVLAAKPGVRDASKEEKAAGVQYSEIKAALLTHSEK